MISSSNLILIVIIGLIILFLFFNNSSKSNIKYQETFPEMPINYETNKTNPNIVKEVVDDVISFDSSYGSNCSSNIIKEKINPNFLDIQFHNDYRDVLTAFNNLVPDKRQRFNLANIPIIYSQPESNEVKHLVTDFIYILNENLKTDIPTFRTVNSGFDELIPNQTVESGFAKMQKRLGLPVSLYDEPAGKSPVKLINIKFVQKYETEDELKYTIDLILQKCNVDDQILIKASFVQDKRPLQDENNFFVTKKIEMKVIIEDLFIIGFLSQYGNDAKLQFDGDKEKFYDYSDLEQNNMTDPKYIQKILMEKYKTRTQEMNQYNALLDEEGQDFYKSMPSLYDFSNIKGTRTIFDDMNSTKVFT